MTIDAYEEPENYLKYQLLRPDYSSAISIAIELTTRYLKSKKSIAVMDFCCGVGNNTKTLAESLKGVQKATLIDINSKLLEEAKKLGILAKEVEVICQNVLTADLEQGYDVVLAFFAYHHVRDDEKEKFISQAKKCLKKDGLLVVTEIYLDDRLCLDYYDNLFNSIPSRKRTQGLKNFLEQTANSSDFEFKVSKKFADKQFANAGFVRLSEVKIWPIDSSFEEDVGTFVQVFRS